MLRFFINLHGICYDVIFRTSIDRAVKVPTTEQCANILVSESIAAFIMQTESNIYTFPVGLPLFLWMLFSYFCIIFDSLLVYYILFACKRTMSNIIIIQIVDIIGNLFCIKPHMGSTSDWWEIYKNYNINIAL